MPQIDHPVALCNAIHDKREGHTISNTVIVTNLTKSQFLAGFIFACTGSTIFTNQLLIETHNFSINMKWTVLLSPKYEIS